MSELLACLKWTSREGTDDERFAGISEADRAALEVALRLAAELSATVTALTVGPPAADRALRDALACGAARAVRIDAPSGLPSEDVARLIGEHAGAPLLVLCGDASADRGSGSVPSFVARRLEVAQALGLVAVTLGADGAVEAVRRLDGGRRERLRVALPCVLSVEGSVANLRRAGLRAALGARGASPEVIHPGNPAATHLEPPLTAGVVTAYRPRARVLPPPAGDDALARVRSLTEPTGEGAHGEVVTLDPPEAAERILAALREWGYLAPANARR